MAAAVQRIAIEVDRHRFTFRHTRRMLMAFSMMLVQASERRSSFGNPSRVTVRISSMPSRIELATPDQSRSRRCQAKFSRSANVSRRYFARSGNISGAIEDFNKAILILPDFVAAYTGRGLTYEKKGEVVNAKADYEKALSLSAEVDAGLARPSKAKARERLAALAAAEAARAKEAAERAEQEARARQRLSSHWIPEDIQKVLQRRGHALLIGQSRYTRGWDELASVRHDLQTLKAGLTRGCPRFC